MSNFVTNPYNFVVPEIVPWYDTLSAYPGDLEWFEVMTVAGAHASGCGANNASSTMIGNTVSEVKVYLKHSDSALTGNILCEVRAKTGDALLASIGSIDASTVTDGAVLYTFSGGASAGHTLADGQVVSLRGDWTASDSYTFDISNTCCGSYYDGGNSGKHALYSTPTPAYTNWSGGSYDDMIGTIG